MTVLIYTIRKIVLSLPRLDLCLRDLFSGYDEEGEYYLLYQISTGGIPARPVGDGPDGHR